MFKMKLNRKSVSKTVSGRVSSHLNKDALQQITYLWEYNIINEQNWQLGT